MDIELIRNHSIKKKGVTEGFPFNEDTLVFKVMNKMFCLANLTHPLSINLKCDPEFAIELREKYEEVLPGFHMNKKHWNTIMLNGELKDSNIFEWIDNSYSLVVNGLTKKEKEKLEGM